MRFDRLRSPCDTAMEFLWDYIDAELAPDAARVVGAHFDACERCGPRLRTSVALKRAVRHASGGVRAPERLRAMVTAAHR